MVSAALRTYLCRRCVGMTRELSWLLHNCVAHPVSGWLRFFGQAIRSERILSIARYMHDSSAPDCRE